MKKLLYILLAAAAIGCSKESVSTTPDTNQTVSFSIIEQEDTRALADTKKVTWSGGDEIAIFDSTADDATPKKYVVGTKVDTTYPLTTTETAYLASSGATFTAYYPYTADRTLAAYKAQTDDADVLISTATTNSSGAATFATFTHENTYLTINLTAGLEYQTAGFTSLTLTLRSGATILWSSGTSNINIADNKETATCELYCNSQTSLAGLKLYMCANGDPISYVLDLGADQTVTAWAGGTPYQYNALVGTPDIALNGTTYEIYTDLGLAAFRDLVMGKGYKDGTFLWDFTSSNFTSSTQQSLDAKLMNDIDLSSICNSGDGTTWSTIGDSKTDEKYKGKFDGNGYEVQNLYINAASGYQGLVGNTDAGFEIKNLGVSGSVTVSGDMIQHVAGLVGYNHGTITNCYNKATVNGDYKSTGGIAGTNQGSIISCYNVGVITGGSDVNTGGIAGNNGAGTISECYNLNKVIASGQYCGGIAGKNGSNSSIVNCYNAGEIESSYSSTYGYVGGIAGQNSGSTIVNVYNTATVTATSTRYVGGLVGQNYSSATLKIGYNIGEVSGSSSSNYVGSVVGYKASGSVDNCYYPNTLTNPSNLGTGETEANMQLATFATTTLKDLVDAYNTGLTDDDHKACYWKAIPNNYPTLDFGNTGATE